MSKPIVKRIVFLAVIFLVTALFAFGGNSLIAYGAQSPANNKNSSNYILTGVQSNKNNHFILKLEVGIDFHSYCDNNDELTSFKNNLVSNFSALLDEEIEKINNKYYRIPVAEYLPSKEIKIGKVEVDTKEQYLSYTIDFSSFEVYSFYNKDITKNYDEGVFVSTLKYSMISPYSSLIGEKSVKEIYTDAVTSASQGLSFEDRIKNSYDPYLFYEFVTPNARVKSTAGTVGVDGDNYYHHIWNVTSLKADQVLSVHLNKINTGWWYLVALVIPLGVMLVVIAVIVIQNKRKKIASNRSNHNQRF